MKKITLHLSAVLLCLCGACHLNAQSGTISAGGNASGGNGSVSYTIGQVAYAHTQGGSGSVNEGLQQPYEFFTVGINQYPAAALHCRVYPNPGITYVILSLEGSHPEYFHFRLYDMNGKLLLVQQISANETVIPVDALTPGYYILKLMDDLREINTFKIIKN